MILRRPPLSRSLLARVLEPGCQNPSASMRFVLSNQNTTFCNTHTLWSLSKASKADTVPLLPVENCPCVENGQETPDLGGLSIDHKSPLANVITRHYRHVLIHTGTVDWPSRIENVEGSLASKLKPLISRGSIFVDPFNPILLSNTSLPPSETAKGKDNATISIFPEAIEISSLPTDPDTLSNLVKSTFLHPSNPQFEKSAPIPIHRITKPVILTCSHGSRDQRCGILGPAITEAFKKEVGKRGDGKVIDAIIGDISHIGGHKFAGNVIIHLPGNHELSKKINAAPATSMSISSPEPIEPHVLESRSVSIWYGRVMPYHAATIIDVTLRNGKIVKDLLRGIVNSEGDLVDLKQTGLL